MAEKAKPEHVWKDRKRYLGLPVSFTRYYIKDQRLFYSKGLFKTVEEELLLYRVLDVKLTRTFGDKLVGVGTITLLTADKTTPKLELERIKNPKQVRDMISKLVEAERVRINVHGKELYGVSNDFNPLDIDGDGIIDTIDSDIS